MALIKMLVFNARKWDAAGGDQPDGNKQFWELCTLRGTYLSDDGEMLAKVEWPDGSITTGHIVSMMMSDEQKEE